MILSTNLTANWRLVRAMDPLLRASNAGRALFFTSSVAKTRPAFWGAYAATKAALEALVDVYADEMENTAVRALCVDPGAMRTRMRSGAFPGEDPKTVPAPETIVPFVVDLVRPDREPPKGVVRFKDRGQESPSIDA
jgi:NAD(P)-dependent dehydrogenase (short-subunit alcohol dehydrogenase family)